MNKGLGITIGVVAASFCLAASAADFEGVYQGTRTVTGGKGVMQYCGQLNSSRPATFTVKGDKIFGGNWSSKIETDGSFKLSGTIN